MKLARNVATWSVLAVCVFMSAVAQAEPRGSAAAGAASPAEVRQYVPRLPELAGQWMDAATLRSLPAMSGCLGSAKVDGDVLSVGDASFPPLVLVGNTGRLSVDGQQVKVLQTRWFPYQVERRGKQGPLEIETAVRMLFQQRGLLWRVTLTNTDSRQRSFDIKIALASAVGENKNWGWGIPRNVDQKVLRVEADQQRGRLTIGDPNENRFSCFAFAQKPAELSGKGAGGSAHWSLDLNPGQTTVIEYVLAVGRDKNAVIAQAKEQAAAFNKTFVQVQADSQACFDAMFTTGNRYFSGHLPVLATSDSRLSRVYYTSVVSLLATYRTGFPIAPRVYVTNTPECNCIMMYFWDTREWATVLAMLDPQMLKEYLKGWLEMGIYRGYAREYLTGTAQGPWYSANDLSVFILLDSYLNVSGDQSFLQEKVAGKTILAHLDAIATNWKRLVRPGRTLADYGEAGNLLECVPTYVHEVPSFNAANVWMMRQAAVRQEAAGNAARAAELRADADRLAKEVLALYEPGEGVWNALHRDGKKAQMRHVFDFATISLTMKDQLTPTMRNEMVTFVEAELLTDHWMRAQSLKDPSAARSDRPDHGPMGAFSAWPAETMMAMCELGRFDKALDLAHRVSSVTSEGPFSQSRELLSKRADATVRIANRGGQTYNASNGGAFADTIIRDFFGCQPVDGRCVLLDPKTPRGFEGRLLNVPCGGHQVNIVSDDQGVHTEAH